MTIQRQKCKCLLLNKSQSERNSDVQSGMTVGSKEATNFEVKKYC